MDRLDELIKHYSFRMNMSVCVTMEESSKYKELRDLLLELQQRRESDLRPADKYLGNSISRQMNHIESEFLEVKEDYSNLIVEFDEHPPKQEKLAEELVDLQMSCETMLAILGLNEQQRMDARRKVVEKNEDRGYYVRMQEGK